MREAGCHAGDDAQSGCHRAVDVQRIAMPVVYRALPPPCHRIATIRAGAFGAYDPMVSRQVKCTVIVLGETPSLSDPGRGRVAENAMKTGKVGVAGLHPAAAARSGDDVCAASE